MERQLCSFAMPDELKERLDEICRELGELKSVVVRRALRQYLAKTTRGKENTGASTGE